MKKNVIRIIKIMLHQWSYLISGLFFMLGFAIFSGTSITLAIPLMDNVFKTSSESVIYRNASHLFAALQRVILQFTENHGSLLKIADKESFQPLIDNLNYVLNHTDQNLLLWVISFVLISIVLVKNLFFFGQRIMLANLRGRTIKDIRNMIYQKYLFQSLAFFDKNKVGDSLVRMVSDVQIIGKFLLNSIFIFIRNIVLILIFARIAFFLNVQLFLIGLILLPLFSLIIHYLGSKIKKYSKRIQNQSSNMFSQVEEKLSSMRIVKAFSREQYEMSKFKEINLRYFKYWIKAQIYRSYGPPISEMNSVITGAIILLIGGSQVLDPSINFTFGSFVTFLLAIFSMLHPFKALTNSYADIRKALVSLERISEILNRDSEIKDDNSKNEKSDFSRTIEFKDVDFSYSGSKNVIHHINFTVTKGQKVALVGSSGAGKTTIVNLLERMYDPISGEILIDGVNIKEFKLNNLRNLMGTVTQESILFNETIKSNISYGTLKEVTEKEITNAAKIAYADVFIEKFSQKYDTVLQTRASNLSGGQKQRLCIARAVVGNPSILIFDEATSALDTEAEKKVQKAIEQATKNRTVIVIAHRLSTVLASDKIVVMDEGKIIDMGTHEELLESCPNYKKLYQLQFSNT